MHRAADPTFSAPAGYSGRGAWPAAAIIALTVALLFINVPVASAAARPSVRLSPSSGPPGTEVTVTGANWPAGHTILASFPDRGFYVAGSATSGADGSFIITFRWPDPATPGVHQVAVIDNTGPADTPPYPEFTVTPGQAPGNASTPSVERAFTTDGSPTEKTTFAPGDPVWYVVTVQVDGAPARGSVRWQVTGPRPLYDYTNDSVEINVGYQAPYSPSTIPADAPAGEYTLTATVVLNGETTVRTSTFTVRAAAPAPQGGLTFQYPLRGGPSAPSFASYGVANPSLAARPTCFGGDGHLFNQLSHAGEDWFRPAGTPVYPVADGKIVTVDPDWDHGAAIVVEHELPEAQAWDSNLVYSVYLHVRDPLPMGTLVNRDTVLARVNTYETPAGNNSHLHWEIRTYASMASSSLPASCKSVIGPSYTDTGASPSNFGYLDPSAWVREHQE